LVVVLTALGAATLLVLRPRAHLIPAIDQQLATDKYAGASACAGCHQRESQDFARTGHARALLRADSESVVATVAGRASPAPADGDSTHRWIEYDWTEGRLLAKQSLTGGMTQLPVEWCFGSGEFGMTFVTILADRHNRSRLLEHHWSWFRDGDVLALTPGHTIDEMAQDYERFGDISDSSATRQCFSCHATAFKFESGRLDTQSVVAGVQCERCHGPRREHAEIKLRTANSAPAQRRTRPSAREQVYACGECHRRPDEIGDEIRPDNPVLARFPSVGLVQSKCFLKTESQGTLTCTTCHDPHSAGRTTNDLHDKRCNDCHDPRRDRDNVPCSIERGDQSCVGCHMPKVRLHEHLEFTDHWIRRAQVQDVRL
jgi:formate-dependent nitrite reductase cytochrome c552 subunit